MTRTHAGLQAPERGWLLRYRAFISYSHADARWAAWLHRRLEGYRLPARLRGGAGEHGPLPERLSPIFRDRDDLSSAGQLGPQIESALADSEALVVVCSPDAARSPYVEAEVLSFKRRRGSERIYAFIVGGEPNAGNANECFPRALRFDVDPDDTAIEVPANPIAADARPGRDGKSLATLKLLAGLFGLPLDTLRQREARRRHQRMTAITALAVAVMLVTSFLAVQAVVARKAAERRQKQAEQLVDFMLGDLNDKLSEVNRLDILSAVNDKAMAYFQSMPKTDITDEAREQRAKALVKIGIVRSEQGDFAKAMQSYEAAAAMYEPLASQSHRDVPLQIDYADSLSYIGMARWYQGDLAGAQRGFDGASSVLAEAQRIAPDDPRLLYKLASVDNNNGHVLEGAGHMEGATLRYRRMLDASRRLVRLDPAKGEWQTSLGLAHNNLAKMALMRGDLPAAISGYREDVAIERRLLERDPRNNAQAEHLLISRATLGRTLALAGQSAEGRPLMQAALAEAKRLHAMEPGSTAFQEDVALYALQLARVQRLQGNPGDAAALVRESLAMFDAMVAASPDQASWQRERAEAMSEQAAQAIAAGGVDAKAQATLHAALAILDPQLAQNPQDRATVLATAEARVLLATIARQPERAALARRALASLDAQSFGLADPRLQALRSEASRLLGREPANRQEASSPHHPVDDGSPTPPQEARSRSIR